MSLPGPAFYDDPDVFNIYSAHRARPDNPNDTLEKPALLELLGSVAGLRLLDLGCGDAALGREALERGAAAYLGVEGSLNMLRLAEQTLAGTLGRVVHADLETWTAPAAAFDLVVSRLALHYLPSLAAAFQVAQAALVPGGRFVFSVEHPVLTSTDRGWRGEGPRQDWLVDDYFVTGRREAAWLGAQVVKYHHTIEDYCLGLQQAGFVWDGLREARPDPARFTDLANYQRRLRIPLFLLLAAHKPSAA
jgi:SAM-dependent methyltransferase